MTALVTGGAGFIGSNLVEYLVSKKINVIVLDNLKNGDLKNLRRVRKNIEFYKTDISKMKNLSKYLKKTEFVFHLAGLTELLPSIKNPSEYFNVNTNGTLNVLEACRKSNIKKFIYVASASCYGDPKKLPISETEEIQTSNPYALTKWIAEKMVIDWAKLYGLPTISLRLFNVYGKGLKKNSGYGSVMKIFLEQKQKNKPLTIVGNGNQTRDFIHIKDVVNALYRASISKYKGQIYNLGTGEETSIKKLSQIFGGKKVFKLKRKGEINRSVANINKIKKDLKWKPKITLKTGVKLFIKNN